MWWKHFLIFVACFSHQARAVEAQVEAEDCWQLRQVQKLGALADDEKVCSKNWQRSARLGMEAEGAGDTRFAERQFTQACLLGDRFSCGKAKTVIEGGDAEIHLESYDKACRLEKIAGACAYLAYHFQLLRNPDLGVPYGALACDLKVARACFDNGLLLEKTGAIETACRMGGYPAACSEFVLMQSGMRSVSDVKSLSFGTEILKQGCLQDDSRSCSLLWGLNEQSGLSKDWFVDNCRDPAKIICRFAVIVEASKGNQSMLHRIGEACKKKVLRACEHLVTFTRPRIEVDEAMFATAAARLCLGGWSRYCRAAMEAFQAYGYLEEAAVFAEKNCEFDKSLASRSQGIESKKPRDCYQATALRKAAGHGPSPSVVPLATLEPKTRYRPRSGGSGAWRTINSSGAPVPRSNPSAVWTGKEVIVWGGGNHSTESYKSGARYNLETNNWAPISSNGAPSGRSGNLAVWTGKAMLIWGGVSGSIYLNSGALYQPESDSWKPISLRGVPKADPANCYVWTGRYLMVWRDGIDSRSSYFRYDPMSDKWDSSPFNLSLGGRWFDYSVTSTGRELIFWGGKIASAAKDGIGDEESDESLDEIIEDINGDNGDVLQPTSTIRSAGMSFDPDRRIWRELKVKGNPSPRYQHVAVWLGSEVLIYGGWTIEKNSRGEFHRSRPSQVGELYDPISGNWRPMPSLGGPSIDNFAGLIPAAGGAFFLENSQALLPKEFQPSAKESGVFADLGIPSFWFDGTTRKWQSLTLRDAPTLRFYAAEVAADRRLFVWGGYTQIDSKGGANYDAGGILGSGSVWTP